MNAFYKARLKLTLWYIFISFCLLTIFTLAAIRAEQTAFDRIVQVISNPVTRPHLTALLDSRINNFERTFTTKLFLFDGLLLIFASIASYFLSGITLKPIQEMVRLQDDFAADASHELRTPLTTIGIEIEALKRTETNIPPAYKQVFTSIQEEVLRMRGIVDGLLTLVRYNTDEAKKNWKKFDITALVKNTHHQMAHLAKEKKLTYILKDNPHIMVYGNEDQVKQVILIFLDNAIKYTPEKESITTELSLSKNMCRFKVSDTGYGIEEHDQAKIFDRFYRAHHSEKLGEKGSGLGLSIARKIITNHGGTTGVKSILSKGSEFYFQLPIRI